MRINWIYSAAYAPQPTHELVRMKEIGPSWGSWKSWRDCSTDNVVCYDQNKTRELLSRAFQSVCNFHVPKHQYQELGRPLGVKLFDGEFKEIVDDLEDIIAMHLASPQSDIVLMMGLDLSPVPPITDRYEKHKMRNRLGLVYQAILSTPSVQWVLVDHEKPLDKSFQKLPNLACDEMKNVLELLV